jgi:hypothetical protein
MQHMSSIIGLSVSSIYAMDSSTSDTLLGRTPAPAVGLDRIPLSGADFAIQRPRLLRLSPSACNVNWSAVSLSKCFTSLVYPTLRSGGFYRRPEVTPELKQILFSLTSLRRLRMFGAGPPKFVRVSPVTGMQIDPANLTAIQIFEIHNTADALTAILMSLSIPPQIHITVYIARWQANRLSPEHRSALKTLTQPPTGQHGLIHP